MPSINNSMSSESLMFLCKNMNENPENLLYCFELAEIDRGDFFPLNKEKMIDIYYFFQDGEILELSQIQTSIYKNKIFIIILVYGI
jgi:hypothetical protein